MKKCVVVFAILALVFSLTACGTRSTMTLEPAQLTDQEKDLQSLITAEGNWFLYDYQVDKTVKTVIIKTYHLDKNGKWKNDGQTLQDANDGGRIAMAYDKTGREKYTAIQSGEGMSFGSQARPDGKEETQKTGRLYANTFLNEKVTITCEKEIPIYIGVASSKEEVSAYDVNTYFEPGKYKGHEEVYASTVTFSKKSGEEIK